MRKLLALLVVLFVVTSVCEPAQARWRLFRRRSRTSYSRSYGSKGAGMTDQQVAYAKAKYCADRNRYYSHGAGGYRLCGTFEGAGCGSHPGHTNHCHPRRPMRRVAEAAVQGSNGVWYKFVGWR